MSTQDLILNIAVNMGRLSRWAMEGKKDRIKQFILDTEGYMVQLENSSQSPKFRSTYKTFKRKFEELKSGELNEIWAEEALTWANILTHRAKLA